MFSVYFGGICFGAFLAVVDGGNATGNLLGREVELRVVLPDLSMCFIIIGSRSGRRHVESTKWSTLLLIRGPIYLIIFHVLKFAT